MSATSLDQPKPKEHRLHALCPYYAMFPPKFARDNILALTKKGDTVLDPFCGRGTSVFEALLQGRSGIGSDVNPVAVVVSQAKTGPSRLSIIARRLSELEANFESFPAHRFDADTFFLPKFFRYAFHRETLKQLLFLRSYLDWKHKPVDRFITALVLGHLHGESNDSPSYLSNQMSHTIAMKPNYAIAYWTRHNMRPPWKDAFDLLRTKAAYRLEESPPDRMGTVIHSDARKCATRFSGYASKVSAVVTSPPYLDVTRFEEDQWLRLWFLGGPPAPTYGNVSRDDRHTNRDRYFTFLSEVWGGIRPLMRNNSYLVCRIGTRHISPEEMATRLTETVKGVWPKSELMNLSVSGISNRQTSILLPDAAGCVNEYDFTFGIAA